MCFEHKSSSAYNTIAKIPIFTIANRKHQALKVQDTKSPIF